MKAMLFTLILFFSLTITVMAGSKEEFVKANAAYNKSDFESAAKIYNNLVNEGNISSELYFNLANSYYRMKQYGNAILYYEKAKMLAPDDEDIEFNINVANTQIIDKIQIVPKFFLVEWFDGLKTFVGSSNYAIFSLASIWLAAFGFVLFMLSNSTLTKKSIFAISSATLFASLLFFYLAYISYQHERNNSFAIVMTISSYVKSSPDEAATDLVILHEGTKLEILDKVSDWYKVRIADGNVGWISASNIEKI